MRSSSWTRSATIWRCARSTEIWPTASCTDSTTSCSVASTSSTGLIASLLRATRRWRPSRRALPSAVPQPRSGRPAPAMTLARGPRIRTDLPLCAAGEVRRAPADAAAARQPRPAADRRASSPSRRRRRCAGCTTCSAIRSRCSISTQPAAELRIESRSAIEPTRWRGPISRSTRAAEIYPFAYSADERPDLGPLLERHYPDPRRRSSTPGRGSSCAMRAAVGTLELLATMTRAIQRELRYAARDERGHAGAGRDAGDGQRHLPRLCAADDGGGARARASAPASSPAISTIPALDGGAGVQGARRHPRLGPGLPARRRLGRVRPDQRHRRRRAT